MLYNNVYSIWIRSPLPSFGSNHVDLGGIIISASETARRSEMLTGYTANATFISEFTLLSSSARAR